MRTYTAFPAIAVLGVGLLTACGGNSTATVDSSSIPRCTPGESAACVGVGECVGVQVCSSTGTFGACACGGGDASTGVPGAPVGVQASAVSIDPRLSVLNESNAFGIAVDGSDNIYITIPSDNVINKITPAGVVTTLAGTGSAGSANGAGDSASFNFPDGLAVDADGNVYVADFLNNLIRKITPAGVVSTLAGTGSAGSANGSGDVASFNHPGGVTVDATGNVYVADSSNNLIRC